MVGQTEGQNAQAAGASGPQQGSKMTLWAFAGVSVVCWIVACVVQGNNNGLFMNWTVWGLTLAAIISEIVVGRLGRRQLNTKKHPYSSQLTKCAYASLFLLIASLVPWFIWCLNRNFMTAPSVIYLWASAGFSIFAMIFSMYRSHLWAKGGGTFVVDYY